MYLRIKLMGLAVPTIYIHLVPKPHSFLYNLQPTCHERKTVKFYHEIIALSNA